MMELHLGLALPSNPIKDLDLNKYENDPAEDDQAWTHSFCSGKNKAQKRSYAFDDALEMSSRAVAQTLPLLSWNDKPNDQDDGDGDRKSLEKSSSCSIHESNGEADGIVGWPPIKLSRQKNLHLHRHRHHHHHYQQQQQNQAGQVQNGRRNEVGSHGPNSMYVKVKMEGIAIGRKVDLSLHRSYQTLTNTLIAMFGKYQGYEKGSNDGTPYILAYQDRDGDWLLVGDIPWQTFIRSVERLKILRTGS